MKFKVLLDSVEKIQEFVKVANSTHCDIDLVSGKYYLDAKSILGILSCNVHEPMTMIVNSSDEEEIGNFKNRIVEFLV